MKPQSPCYGCEERHNLCHCECEKYLSFRSELDKYNDMVRKRKEEDSRIRGYKLTQMKRGQHK